MNEQSNSGNNRPPQEDRPSNNGVRPIRRINNKQEFFRTHDDVTATDTVVSRQRHTERMSGIRIANIPAKQDDAEVKETGDMPLSPDEAKHVRRTTGSGTPILTDGYTSGSALKRKEREELLLAETLDQLSPSDRRRYKRELMKLRTSLRKRVSGKPTRPAFLQTTSEVTGRFVGRVLKITALLLATIIFFVGGIGGGMLLAYFATTETLDPTLFTVGSQTSTMYGADGEIISISTGSSNTDREYVSIHEVKHTYIDEAFIAIEDERFYDNIGIDPRRIASAVVSALANGGTATHGGSTIAQQTVKMLTGKNQISASRKVQEWYNAIQLKQTLTDDEILELYINLVPMANSYVGIQSAAKAYFNKNASEISLEEAAFLAGIPKGPSIYNPLTETGMRNALRRQRIVLAKMYELMMITEAQYNAALNNELVFRQTPPSVSGTSINSYFAEHVYEEVVRDLQTEKGYTLEAARNIVFNGGVEIFTTFDAHVQSYVDATFNKPELFAADPGRYIGLPEKPEAGLAVIDNQTGAVIAMGGGYGEKSANLVLNRATDIQRQPGSSSKPLNVYAPAIEMNKITGATIIEDELVYMDPDNPDTPYPRNAYYPEYRGKMTVRNAVKISNNVPAAKVMEMIGLDNSKYYLAKTGIDRINDPARISMSVGGFQQGMSPLEMASAFSVFPSGGIYTKPYAYTKVLDVNGNVLLSQGPDYEVVYRPDTAFMMTKIMEETILGANNVFYYEGSAYLYGMVENENGETISTAGKTGTTDDQKDKWFVGFTPYYTAAVWYGLDTPRAIPGSDNEGAKRIWFDVFDNLLLDYPAADWEQPSNIVALDIDVRNGLLARPECTIQNPLNVVTEYFVAGHPLTPTDYCDIHGSHEHEHEDIGAGDEDEVDPDASDESDDNSVDDDDGVTETDAPEPVETTIAPVETEATDGENTDGN